MGTGMSISEENGTGIVQAAKPMVPSGMMSIEQQRAIAETQAAMFVAKQFPRDINDVLRRLAITCSRKSVAQVASFSFPRGGEEITGPSVYLLKTIAQEWGNLTYGVKELSRANGVSQMESFAWDMERNVREVRNFEVKHWRDTRQGGYQLKDERDIYELLANMGSRRLRACLEGVIPEDVKAYAVALCDKTLIDGKIDTPEYRAELLEGFNSVGVSKERIEARLGKLFTAATANQLLKLTRGLTAIRDGVTTADEAFPPIVAAEGTASAPATAKGTAGLKDRLKAQDAKPAASTTTDEDL